MLGWKIRISSFAQGNNSFARSLSLRLVLIWDSMQAVFRYSSGENKNDSNRFVFQIAVTQN